jgi:hypothetical protein
MSLDDLPINVTSLVQHMPNMGRTLASIFSITKISKKNGPHFLTVRVIHRLLKELNELTYKKYQHIITNTPCC